MQYIDFKSLLYSDTLVPDIFMSEYLPALQGDYVKIYLYCLFLAGKGRTPSVPELARILDMAAETVKKGLHFMDNLGLLTWTEEGVLLADLKEKQINKLYKPVSALAPEDAARGLMVNERRRQVITAINDTFFSGVMSPGWFGEITRWFEIYGFEEDVMLMLFRHCCDHGGLGSAYVAKVAENWHKKGIRNAFDVDRYLREYAAMKTASRQIHKKLRLRSPFTEYQEGIIDKWVNGYGFSMDVIERALMQSSWKLEAGLAYYDKILATWHEAGLDTAEKVDAHLKARRKAARPATGPFGGAADGGGSRASTGLGPSSRSDVGDTSRGMARKYKQGGYPQREFDDALYAHLVSSKFGGRGEGPQDAGRGEGQDAAHGEGRGEGRDDGQDAVQGEGWGEGQDAAHGEGRDEEQDAGRGEGRDAQWGEG